MELTRDWLYDQYITQEKTVIEICNEFGLKRDTVAHKLSDYGIHKINRMLPYKDKDWLYDQYITKDKTMNQIANEVGCRQSCISHYCKKFGIIKEQEPRFTREFLYEEHIVKHKSMKQIAKETNANNVSVRKYLDLYGIPVWTCHDNTNEYVDNGDGTTNVKAYDQYGEYKGCFIVDTQNVNKINNIKWILVIDKIVENRARYRVTSGSHPSVVLARFLLDINDDNLFVDHRDNNPLNNVMENLRVVSRSENQSNHDLHINNTSGFAGVVWNKIKSKWHAQIKSKNIVYHLGNYVSKSDAVYARYYAETILFGNYRSDRNDENIMNVINCCNNKEYIEKYVSSAIKRIRKRWENVNEA